jgi:hypothetical protein
LPTEVVQETRRKGRRHARIDVATRATMPDGLFAVLCAEGTFKLPASADAKTPVVFTNSLPLAVFIALLLSVSLDRGGWSGKPLIIGPPTPAGAETN